MSLLTNTLLCLNLTHLNVKSKISAGLTHLLNKQVFIFLTIPKLFIINLVQL